MVIFSEEHRLLSKRSILIYKCRQENKFPLRYLQPHNGAKDLQINLKLKTAQSARVLEYANCISAVVWEPSSIVSYWSVNFYPARYTYHNNGLTDELEHIETWIRCFAVLARIKKLKDEKASRRENEITDIYLATAGGEALKKISKMAYPRELEFTHEEIVRIIMKNIWL